jgi:DNA primase
VTDHGETLRAVRQRLSKPAFVAKALGLKVDHDSGGYTVTHCPVHGDRNPSFSVYKKNGSVRARCHGCEWRGDVLDLIGAVHGITGFREQLAAACELAGMYPEADELRGGKKAPRRAPLATPEPEPERDYPPAADVALLWSACIPVTEDAEVSSMLRERNIDPESVARLGIGAALHPLTHASSVPEWARFKGRTASARPWTSTGHRLILPVFDHAGAMRSVRAWLVNGDAALPKRVPPRGYRASGLVLANHRAQRWLRGEASPSTVVVCEGEPDTLVRAVAFPLETIIGVGSGSWTDDFAARVPFGSTVALMTHLDGAGDRYADEIAKSVDSRAQVTRWTAPEPEAA